MASSRPVLITTRPDGSDEPPDDQAQASHSKAVEDLTIRSYALAVRNFARLSTGAGLNHGRLAEVLFPFAIDSNYAAPYRPSAKPETFLNVYRFNDKTLKHLSPDLVKDSSNIRHEWVLEGPLEFPSCASFHAFEPASSRETPGHLLFLRGQWSGEWIGLVASKFQVDPEFFCQMLDFRSASDRTNNFSMPNFPAMSWNTVRLPLMTIGSREAMNTSISRAEMKKIRQDCARQMEQYHNELEIANTAIVGTSMVRDYHIFDSTNFAMEQAISICLQPTKDRRGWTCLVWSDIGDVDIMQSGFDGPWTDLPKKLQSQRTRTFPVISLRPNTGLFAHKVSPHKKSTNDLHIDYGRSLRQELMVNDPFYALHEVFTHSACSEKQFLNLIESKLSKYIEETQNQQYDNLSDLSYIKEILYNHLKYNQRVCSFIKLVRQHPKWVRGSSDRQDRQNGAVLDYFQDLSQQAEMSYNRCQAAIAVLMNSISIAEAERSILHAKRVGKLTFLAFIFVPLSFTTSFFGMNLEELGSYNSPGLWIWFVVSSTVLISTMLFFYIDFQPYAQRAGSRCRGIYDNLFQT